MNIVDKAARWGIYFGASLPPYSVFFVLPCPDIVTMTVVNMAATY